MMLIESRIHWAIKRNVLRDTVSEDLEWAQCIKNDHEELFGRHNDVKETRSLQSTPERKLEKGRDKSCNDRIFGSASSQNRLKRHSRVGSRRSSISSNMNKGLNKSKSKDILVKGNLLESKSLRILNKETQGSKNKRMRDGS